MQTLPGPIILFISAWNTFKAHWKLLISISFIPYFILFFAQIFLATKNIPYIFIGTILTIIGSLISVAMQPAIVTAIHKVNSEPGTPMTLKGQYKLGFSFFWPLLGLCILNGVIILGSLMLFIIPALVVGIYTSLYIFNRVLDDKKGLTALTENYSLIKGRWWGTFGRQLFLLVIYVVFSLIIMGLQFIIVSIFGISMHTVGGYILSGILNMVTASIMVPFALVYLYNLFVSLKSTRAPEVQTAVFRKWLVAFMVIGIIVLVVMPILGFGLFVLTASHGKI